MKQLVRSLRFILPRSRWSLPTAAALLVAALVWLAAGAVLRVGPSLVDTAAACSGSTDTMFFKGYNPLTGSPAYTNNQVISVSRDTSQSFNAACSGKTYWYFMGTNGGDYYNTSGKYGFAYRFSSSGDSYNGAQFTAVSYDILAHAPSTTDGIHQFTSHVDRCTGAVTSNPTGFQGESDGGGQYSIWGWMFDHGASTCSNVLTGDNHNMRLDRVVPTMSVTAVNGGATGLCNPTCGSPLPTSSSTVSLSYSANDPAAANGYLSGFHSVDGDGITSGYIRWFWSNGSGWQSCGQLNNPGTTANQQTLTGSVNCTLPNVEGTYSLTAVSQDLAGNCSDLATISSGVCFASGSTPVKARVFVDLTVPTVTGTTAQWSARAMSWTESDAGGEAQATYHVDVATDSGYTNIISTSGDTAGTATLWSIPTTVSLTDDTKYYWRVRASDGANWSSWWTGSFTYDAYLRGDESYYQRVPFDLSGGYTISVGIHNGEATLTRAFFTIPSYGPPQALSMTYSALEPSANGRFGYGWVSNLTQYLTFENGLVVWHRDDGGREAFALVGSTWTVQGAHYETMTTGSGTYVITMKDQTKLAFQNASPGRLLSLANRFGKALTLVWNTSSATATDASGRATTLTIDSANNRITEVEDSALRTWDFGYDASNNLATITEPGPDPAHPTVRPLTTLGYDGSHCLTTITRVRSRAVGSPETLVWAIGYDSNRRATSVTDPLGALVTPTASANTFTYNAGSTVAGLLQTYSPVVRNATTYTLDAFGRPVSILDPGGWTTTQAYDAAGDLTSITRPINTGINATTTYTYDTRGNVLTETQPTDATHSDVTVDSYNSTNDLVTQSLADNDATAKVVTLYTYDGSGHLTSEVDDCTSTGTTLPSPASSCTGAGTHDASTNVTTAYSYTSNDQLQTETDPVGVVTLYAYDSTGDQTSEVQNCTSSGTTPPVPPSSCTAAGTHNASTNVTTATAYDSGVMAGKIGLPTSVTDAVGNVTNYTYDQLGRQLTTVEPGDSSIPVSTTTTAYDELGDVLTSSVNWTGLASPEVTTTVYDLVGQMTSTTDAASQVSTSTWDAAGDELSTVASGVTHTRTFDHLGRVSTETNAGVATTYTYDAQGDALTALVTSSPTRTSTDTFDYLGDVLTDQVAAGGITVSRASTYDVLGRELTATAPSGTVTTRTYDRLSRQTHTVKAGTSLSVSTDYVFDAAGRQTQQTGPYPTGSSSLVTNFTFGPLSRPVTETDNVVSGSSDPSANVAMTTYADADGHTVATVDPRGIVTRQILNPRGLPSEQVVNCTDSGTTPSPNPSACVGAGTHDGATNLVTLYTYDGAGNLVDTTVVGAAGNVTTERTLDADGRVVKTVVDKGGLNIMTQTAYDSSGHVIATRDANGTDTRSMYDTNGRLQETIVNCTDAGTTVPGDSTWTTCAGGGTHDGTWNLVTAYTYDGQGNEATETAPNGRVTNNTYDGVGRMVSQTQNYVASPTRADQNLTTYDYYDGAGRQTAVKVPTVDRSTFVVTRVLYDDLGRVVSQIRNCTDSGTSPPSNPATCAGGGTANADTNVVTTYGYDATGNQISVGAPSPAASGSSTTTVMTQRAYIDGRLCRVVENATGSTNLQALTDPCSSPTQTGGTATTNVSTIYRYDAAGNLAQMTDGQGDTTQYSYDGPGRLIGQTDANGKTLAYGYDERGNRFSQTNRSDTTPLTPSIAWTFDNANRMTGRTADGVMTRYTYDPVGNQLTAALTSTGTIATIYDRLNRPLTVSVSSDSGASTSYAYTLTSTSWTDPTGSYLASLDAFNRQTSLTDPIHGSIAFTTTFRADGLMGSTGDPVGNTGTLTYDNLGRTTTNSVVGGGAVSRASYTWTVNRAGNELSEVSTVSGDPTNGTATYAYDPLGRLTSYGRTGAQTETYSWQAVPNRATKQVGTGTIVTTSYDVANRPLSDTSGASYTNDLDGRLTAAPGQTFDWDSLGHLLDVKSASNGTTIASYTYDALDRLFIVNHPGVSRIRFRYVGTSQAVAQEVDDASGTVLLNVGNDVAGGALLDWTSGSSAARVYGSNEHGDVTWTGSATGSVSGTLRYDPWGNVVGSSGAMPDWRWQGSWMDATTGLLETNTRWYSPGLVRFISEDSLAGTALSPGSENLYAFGEGDPVDRADRNGTDSRYGAANSTYGVYRFRNPAAIPGSLYIALFIPEYSIWTGLWLGPLGSPIKLEGLGDNRGFSSTAPYPDCYHTRVCIVADLHSRWLLAVARPSCGLKPQECADARSFGDPYFGNNLGLSDRVALSAKSRVSGFHLDWDLNQSFTRVGPVYVGVPFGQINGSVDISWADDYILRFRIANDAFPAVELYYVEGGVTRLSFRMPDSGDPNDLGPLGGKWVRVYNVHLPHGRAF